MLPVYRFLNDYNNSNPTTNTMSTTTYSDGAAYPSLPPRRGGTSSGGGISSSMAASVTTSTTSPATPFSSSSTSRNNKPTRVGAYLVNNQQSSTPGDDPNYFHLQVPPNVLPGSTFQFVTGGTIRYTVRCPPEAGPGSILQVALLPSERKPMYTLLSRAPLTLGPSTCTTMMSDEAYNNTTQENATSQGGADPMTNVAWHHNRELLTSMQQQSHNNNENQAPASKVLIVKIPDNVEEGMSFVVKTTSEQHKRRLLVKCPVGARPGMKIQVPIPHDNDSISDVVDNLRNLLPFSSNNNTTSKPASSTQQSRNQQFKLFDIVVPPGATPNQLLPVNVYGKRVPVRLPSTVTEGETITLKVPLQDVVKDIELDYEQLDTSLTGGWNRTIRMEDLKFQWVNGNNSNNDSTRSIALAVRDIAFVRNLIRLEGNDKRLQAGVVDLIPADEAVTESEFRLHPFSKPLVTYANTAHHIQSKSSLEMKQAWLYQHVFEPLKTYSMQDDNKVRLVVRRSNLLADSVHCVLSLSPKEMRKKWQVEFVGEPALDYGGVMREWMQLVSEQVFNPDLGLWLSSVNNQVLMRINPACYVSCPDEYLVYFRFIGRLMGRALLDRQVIHGHMTRHLYKHLLGWPVTFDDLEEQDEEYYENLKRFTRMGEEELAQLYLDFTVTEDILGTRKTVELVTNGAEQEVTSQNLMEYLEAILRYRMLERNKLPIQELVLGFLDVVPEAALTVLDPNELELILCGLPIIDIEDWQANTILTGKFENRTDAKAVQWFWQIVRDDFDQEMTARLLQFCTGTSGVPSLGFSNLLGNDGNIKLFTIHGVSPRQYPYPRSHTCFNRIDLPEYTTKQELFEKLKAAVSTSAVGFGIE